MSRIEQLRKLAQIEPDDPLAHYGLALEWVNLQDWEQAILSFGETLRLDPKYTAAYYHKARAEIGAGLGQDARGTLERGIQAANAAGDEKTAREMGELRDTIV